MRFIFFSDIHGNQYAFKVFLRQIKHMALDLVIFGGDVFGYYYGQEYILNEMKKIKNFFPLLGNHDYMYLECFRKDRDYLPLVKKYGKSYSPEKVVISQSNIDWLKTWPLSYTFLFNNKKYTFIHGSLKNPLNGRIYPDTEVEHDESLQNYDYLFLGHTHHKMQKKVLDTTILNPGSLGQQRDGKGCSYLFVDTEQEFIEWRIVDYNIKLLEAEVLHNDPQLKERFVEVLYRNNI